MKKISKTIAMILVLVMIASSFSSCWTIKLFKDAEELKKEAEAEGKEYDPLYFALNLPLVILGDLFVIAVIVVVVGFAIALAEAQSETDTGIYLANAENDPLAQYYSAMEIFDSLPETEKAAVMEKFSSLSEEKIAALVSSLNALPQAEVAASIERVNALSETELVSTVQTLNALTEDELDSLTDTLKERANSLPVADYVAMVNVHNQKQYMALSFQY